MNLVFKIKEQEFRPLDFELRFLYPYLLRFAWKLGYVPNSNFSTVLDEKQLGLLENLLSEALKGILQDGKTRPSERQISKRPGPPERISYEGKQYVVDNKTSHAGRLAYYTASRIKSIQNARTDPESNSVHFFSET